MTLHEQMCEEEKLFIFFTLSDSSRPNANILGIILISLKDPF